MLRLRPYKKCDATYIVKWIKDEITFQKWSANRYKKYPITDADMNDYYENEAFSDNLFPMTAFDETGIVGHLIMRFTDEEKETLRFGFIIVDDSKRGKGYGKKMLLLALKYAFEILKVKKVTIGVFENNENAYNCYKSIGFKDSTSKQAEIYRILNEDWKCLELEIDECSVTSA